MPTSSSARAGYERRRALSPATAWAQGRGGATWTTVGGDAQRTASVRNDPKINAQSVAKDFKLLWKHSLKMPSMPADALTQPVLLPNIISFKGFKALAFVGGDHDNVYAVDYDLSRLFWSRHLDAARTRSGGSAACPGGLTTITRATSLTQAGGGRGGRGAPGGGRGGAPAAPANPPMPGSGPGANAGTEASVLEAATATCTRSPATGSCMRSTRRMGRTWFRQSRFCRRTPRLSARS